MTTHRTPIALAALITLAAAGGAQAQVFGSLANFDVVNNTGRSAYGFEIEIEDSRVYKDSASAYAHSSQNYVDSVFGLNRDFGLAGGPTGVVRFGSVNLVDYDINGVHAGVRIQYGFAAGASTPLQIIPSKITPFTPVGFSTPGESCWPGANANWSANPCDHFGVTTTGGAALTRYSWVLDNAGTLGKQAIGIPAVNITPFAAVAAQPAAPNVPALPAQPARVELQIQAVDDRLNNTQWGEAFWVKTFTTKIKNNNRGADKGNIDLGDLLLRGGQIDGRDADTKTVFRLFQKAPDKFVDGLELAEPMELVENRVDLGADDKSVIVRYEFFQYTGGYDARDHKADCGGGCASKAEKDGELVGDFLGRQIAGFNAVQPLAAAVAVVPEPESWALMLAGLVGLGFIARRRSR